jgi:hypothetical protein
MNLSTGDVRLFYKLHGSLLAYANRHLKVIPRAVTFESILEQPKAQIIKLRDALHSTPELLERFVAENPEHLPPEELALVGSWRHRVSGDLYIVRYLKPYTVFMSGTEPPRLYGVLGLIDPLEVVVRSAPLPIWVKAVLLPFRDRIVYDGLITSYSIYFGKGFRTSINEAYNRLKESEGIIEQLVNEAGGPQSRTHLASRLPRKPAPDWRPALDEIVAQTERMRRADTKLQEAALSLLRAAAHLTQAALEDGRGDAAARQLRSVRMALTKVEKLLFQASQEGVNDE